MVKSAMRNGMGDGIRAATNCFGKKESEKIRRIVRS